MRHSILFFVITMTFTFLFPLDAFAQEPRFDFHFSFNKYYLYNGEYLTMTPKVNLSKSPTGATFVKIEYYWDGQLIYSEKKSPFKLNHLLQDCSIGKHTLRVALYATGSNLPTYGPFNFEYPITILALSNNDSLVVENEKNKDNKALQTTISFYVDRYYITDEQKKNVKSVAQFLMKNPDINLIVTGYADIETAYPAYNLRLSQKRAQAVYDMLVNDFHVSKNRLRIDYKDEALQPLVSTNEWNRAVVFSQYKDVEHGRIFENENSLNKDSLIVEDDPIKALENATIEWLDFKSSTTEKLYALNLGIKTKTRMDGYKIMLNGDVVLNKKRGSEETYNGYPHEIHEILTLRNGENKIRVEVTNAAGVTPSERTVICNMVENVVKPERRLALVIGNNMYKTKGFPSLDNPINDARALATKLKSFGFEVMEPTYNADVNKMGQVITQFIQNSINYDVVLFYYAGHGMQMRSGLGSDNWLVPSSSVPNDTIYEEDVPKRCINANTEVVDALKRSGCKAGIIILDACRNYEKLESKYRTSGSSRGASNIKERGLGEMRPDGFCVVYSTEEGKSANDGEKGHNSPFVESLLECLDNYADQPIETFFKKVRITTEEKTQRFGEKQKPYIYDGLSGDFFFKNKN